MKKLLKALILTGALLAFGLHGCVTTDVANLDSTTISDEELLASLDESAAFASESDTNQEWTKQGVGPAEWSRELSQSPFQADAADDHALIAND